MNHLTNSFTYDEKEFVVSTLVPKDMLEQGELMLDDQGHVLIQIVCQNDSYILFDDTVQLGIPEAVYGQMNRITCMLYLETSGQQSIR